MIVESMTNKEVLNELKSDLEDLLTDILSSKKLKFRRTVLKNNRFPMMLRFEAETPRRNKYMCILMARKRSDHKNPMFWFCTTRHTNKGYISYSIYPDVDGISFCVHYPHFYDRFNERFLKSDLSKLSIVKRYFKDFYNRATQEVEGGIVGTTGAGMELGYKKDGLIHFKTFITKEMFRKDQKLTSLMQRIMSNLIYFDDIEITQMKKEYEKSRMERESR